MMFAKILARDDQDESGFGHADHLLLWAWRRITFGQAECPLLVREFLEACGPEGAEVFMTLRVFLHALGAACPYRLSLGMPGGSTLTRDERRVLTLLAAAQTGDGALFEHSLDALARREWRHVVAMAGNALAKALAVNGLHVRPPLAETAMACPQQAMAS